MIDVLDRTKGVDDQPGWRALARRWLAWGPGARARVADEAAVLARASFRPASLAAVGRTGARAARAAGPGMAADLRRRAREGVLEKGAAIKHVQELVKA